MKLSDWPSPRAQHESALRRGHDRTVKAMGRAGIVGRGTVRGAFALALASLLSGCLTTETVPGPNIEAPPKYRAAAIKPHAALPAPDWWRGFRSRELTVLVERAHLANLDIAAAVARIEQADAQTRIAGAPLLPVIGFDGSATRSGTGTTSGSNTFRAVLNASYEIDFWGKNRAALRSAEFAAVASRFDREVIVLSTVSTVINTYFQILAAQDRLRIARSNVDAATRILKVFQDRHRRRHRERPRHRAAGIAGRAAARRDPAARSATAAEHRDARGAARRRARARHGARRQPDRHRGATRLARAAVRPAAAAPRHPRGRGAACRRECQCRKRARRAVSDASRSPARAAM